MKPQDSTIRLWDLPTRLFHWTLVVCVVGAYTTVKLGGLWMDWHIRFGLAVLGLISFRVVWGFCGPHYARFRQFVRGPVTVWRYTRGMVDHVAGHNPLGACSIVALMLVLGFQAFSGLFANDDVLSAGPLAHLNADLSATLTGLHKLNEWLVLSLVVLHVGAIFWYQKIRKQDLIGPMIVGDARVPPGQIALAVNTQDSWKLRLAALILALLIATVVWWISGLGSGADSSYL